MTQFTDVEIAEVAHNTNAAFQGVEGETPILWNDLPDDAWQRDDTLRQINLLRDQPDFTPKDDHEKWKTERETAGWTYGETKDSDAKTSPLLVPWEDLPFRHRARSEAAFAVIRVMLG